MSDLFNPATVSAIGAFTALTPASSDYLAIDRKRCSGGSDADLTLDTEDAPGEDGVLIFPPLDSGDIITLVGDLVVTSTGMSAEAGYDAAIATLYDSLKSAVDAGKTGTIDLVHAGGTLKCWKYSKVDPSWPEYWVCTVTFSLIVDVFA